MFFHLIQCSRILYKDKSKEKKLHTFHIWKICFSCNWVWMKETTRQLCCSKWEINFHQTKYLFHLVPTTDLYRFVWYVLLFLNSLFLQTRKSTKEILHEILCTNTKVNQDILNNAWNQKQCIHFWTLPWWFLFL